MTCRFAAVSLIVLGLPIIAVAQQPISGSGKQQPIGAQQPFVTKIDRPPVAGLQAPPPPTHFAPTPLTAPTVTPELWVYSQEQQRHDDPAQAVRRKAEYQAEQRMARLASQKWYGYSNSRPDVNFISNPGTYSPAWVGNAWNRYGWVGSGYYWW